MGAFSTRLGYLQIQKGGGYLDKSNNNVLEKQIIFNDRELFMTEIKVELAWNKKVENLPTTVRTYLAPGFSSSRLCKLSNARYLWKLLAK